MTSEAEREARARGEQVTACSHCDRLIADALHWSHEERCDPGLAPPPHVAERVDAFLADVDRRADQLSGIDLTAYVPRQPRIGTPFADLIREHDRQAAERRREQLNAGRWTDAGGPFQVRFA